MLIQPALAGDGVAKHQPHLVAIAPATLQRLGRLRVGAGGEVGLPRQRRASPGIDGAQVLGVAVQRAVVAGNEGKFGPLQVGGDLVGMTARVVEAQACVAIAAGDDLQPLFGIQGHVHGGFLEGSGGTRPQRSEPRGVVV